MGRTLRLSSHHPIPLITSTGKAATHSMFKLAVTTSTVSLNGQVACTMPGYLQILLYVNEQLRSGKIPLVLGTLWMMNQFQCFC